MPLPPGHRFPIAKYALLREGVVAAGIVADREVLAPARAPLVDVRAVHTSAYLDALLEGSLTSAQVRRLGFPWSAELVERSFRAAGGTWEAAEAALSSGVAMNLAGGTHHAFPGHGEGFCVLNDVAIAIHGLRRLGRIQRALVVDLDVHQGNGTHAIFAADPDVFTFSMHGARNYPYALPARAEHDGPAAGYGGRVDADLDVPLPDGIDDDAYLSILRDALPRAITAARADIAFYLAGADPHEGDRLGRMHLTFDGLERRDAFVIATCREIGLPVAVTIAGGYGYDVHDTVRAHVSTARIAREYVR